YVFNAARHLSDEIIWDPKGRVVARAQQVLGEARDQLREVKAEGMFSAVARGAFADVKRPETGGRGLAGVVEKTGDYVNPILDALEGKS
ncbi:MAG: kamD, partial [bacterium]|nr:kamD [bacterium]